MYLEQIVYTLRSHILIAVTFIPLYTIKVKEVEN